MSDPVNPQDPQPIINVTGPTHLDIQEMLSSREGILPNSFETIDSTGPKEKKIPLEWDEAIKFGLIHNEESDKQQSLFLIQLGYLWAAGNNTQRTRLANAFNDEIEAARIYGEQLWQKE